MSVVGIPYTYDRNFNLIVNTYALITHPSFLKQIAAAVKLGKWQQRQQRDKERSE